MRLPDDNKRRQIIATAADMFVSQPFHKVRLDDVAAAAGVGKGTLYVYFKSKEDLYFTIAYETLGSILQRLRSQLATDHSGAAHRIRTIVDELVDFAFQNPHFFELMKTVGLPNADTGADQRNEMFTIIEETIRAGVESGELRDTNPHLTARYIPGFVRSAMTYAGKDLDPTALKQHIFTMLERGLICGVPSSVQV